MPLTNFPNGVSSFGIPQFGDGNLIPPTTGTVFFVDAGAALASDNAFQGKDPTNPYKTIDFAIGQCIANNGDMIIVMPGHTETVAAAAGIAVDVAGISIIGLGHGSDRPLLTFSATASTVVISAANCLLRNLQFTCSISEVVVAFSVTAAGCTIDAVDYVETATFQLIQFLLTVAAADDLTVKNCYHVQNAAAIAATQWILLVGTDRARILNNTFLIATTNAVGSNLIVSATTAPKDIIVAGNVLMQLGGASVIPLTLMTATTGYVYNNRVASPKTAIAGSIALASCYGSENYASNTVNLQGILDPVADV